MCLQATITLETAQIAHYDIKCDNVLLTTSGGSQTAGTTSLTTAAQMMPIEVVLGDFGVAANFDDHAVGNRGTECIKVRARPAGSF